MSNVRRRAIPVTLALSGGLGLLPVTGQAQSALVVGRRVAGTVARADTARYTLRADSGFVLHLRVTQVGDVSLRLVGPRKAVVKAVNDARRGPEELHLVTTASGAYELQVTAADSTGGNFTVSLLMNERLAANPAQQVDQLLAPWNRRDGPGAAVAVWRGGKTLFAKAYGMANLAYDIPFTVATPTNIGSTSKQFTAFAVMLLVEEGKLTLDDDVRKHIPELPDLGKTVTVRHLLTHTSGYRELYNQLALAGRRLDESDHVGREEYIPLVQRQPALQNAPGAEFNYNNTAFGLAAMIVARVSTLPFEQFMAERVFRPIGMTATQVRADVRVPVRGASVGYTRSAEGVWRDLGDLGGSMGAGGIYTTLGDLQRWVAHLANPRVGTRASIAQMMTPYTLSTGKSTGYGLGLFIDQQQSQKRVHHGGADVSHRSMLAIYPDLDAAITVQSNDGRFDSSVAFRIASAFFPELAAKPTTTTAFDAARWDVKQFDPYTGRYAFDQAPGLVLTVGRSADTLHAQLTGQGRFTVLPTSDTTFAVQGVAATLIFLRDDKGQANRLILDQGGQQRLTRVAAGVAEAPAWKPTVAELQALAGRYFSEELETYWELALVNNQLTVAQRRVPSTTVSPSGKDTMSGVAATGPFTLALERDRNGRVIAFYAGNGRTRDIRFVRVR